MAKVKGPLMSMEASGTFGGSLTFGNWKGVAYCRQHVIPHNPNSEGQAILRNRVRITGSIQKWANRSVMVEAGQTKTDKARISAITPSDKTWNSYLVTNAMGAGSMIFKNAESAFDALSSTEQTAWDNAAKALSPAIDDTFQKAEAGGTDSVVSSGKTFFIYRNALANMHLATPPNGTPPTYA